MTSSGMRGRVASSVVECVRVSQVCACQCCALHSHNRGGKASVLYSLSREVRCL
eukprot:COSAG06_NODE_5901_length_3222_cov_4.093180_2_plen_54_part_00